MKRSFALAAAGLSASLLVMTGCSSETSPANASPKERLSAAAESLTTDRYATWDFSLEGTPEDFVAFSADSADPLTTDVATQILNSSLTIKADAGEDKESSADDLASVSVVADGTRMGEFMSEGQENLYMQINTDGIREKFPETAPQLDMAKSYAEASPALATLLPLLSGSWVNLPMGPGTPLGDYLAQQGTSSETPDPAQMEAVRDRLETAMREVLASATVVEDKDDEDHLIASVNARTAYTTLRPALVDAFASLGSQGAALESELPPVGEAPDKVYKVDVFVKDGHFTKVSLPMNQFSKTAPKGVVSLTINMSDEADIELPSDADELDLAPLLSMANPTTQG